jgi:hypothetical protein
MCLTEVSCPICGQEFSLLSCSHCICKCGTCSYDPFLVRSYANFAGHRQFAAVARIVVSAPDSGAQYVYGVQNNEGRFGKIRSTILDDVIFLKDQVVSGVSYEGDLAAAYADLKNIDDLMLFA